MNSAGQFILSLAVALGMATALRAETAATDKPYASIGTRNVFGLVPIPVAPPADPGPPPEPPPKITPNGITSIFGKLQVLYKVAEKPVAGQPPKESSHMLSEGEREDEITVIKINKEAGVVTFDNHGETQELPLVTVLNPTGPAGAPGAPGTPANPFVGGGPGMTPAARIQQMQQRAAMQSLQSQFNPNNGGVGNPGVGGVPMAGMGGAGGAAPTTTPPAEQLSPEAQVLMIEKNRLETQQAVDVGLLPPLPPTPITPAEATAFGGSPLIAPPPEQVKPTRHY
jgi:hypothetical protein